MSRVVTDLDELTTLVRAGKVEVVLALNLNELGHSGFLMVSPRNPLKLPRAMDFWRASGKRAQKRVGKRLPSRYAAQGMPATDQIPIPHRKACFSLLQAALKAVFRARKDHWSQGQLQAEFLAGFHAKSLTLSLITGFLPALLY